MRQRQRFFEGTIPHDPPSLMKVIGFIQRKSGFAHLYIACNDHGKTAAIRAGQGLASAAKKTCDLLRISRAYRKAIQAHREAVLKARAVFDIVEELIGPYHMSIV